MDGIFQYKGKVNIPDIELPKRITHSFGIELEGVENKPLSEVEEAIIAQNIKIIIV